MGIFISALRTSGVRTFAYCVPGDAGARCAIAQDLIRPEEVTDMLSTADRVNAFRSGAAVVIALKLRALLDSGRIRYNADEDFCDLWRSPKLTRALKYGDCEDLSFLVASLLAALGCEPVIVIGRVHTGHGWAGHAWVEGRDMHGGFLIEATSGELHRGVRPEEYAPEFFVTRHSCHRAA